MSAHPKDSPVTSREIVCTSCGAIGHAGCDCDAPCVRTDKALANPNNSGRSTRDLAREIGVGHVTIKRGRDKLAASGVSGGTPEKVVGLDGKSYPAIRPRLAVDNTRKLKPVRLEDVLDPLTIALSSLGKEMDNRTVESVIEAQRKQFDLGWGVDRTYIERLEFMRNWLDALIEGSEKFVVVCSTNGEES